MTLTPVSINIITGSLQNSALFQRQAALSLWESQLHIWQLGLPFSSPISTLSLRPSEPPSGQRVVGGGGRGWGKGYGKRRIFAWPVYRLLGFSVKAVYLHISGEPPVWGHTDAWVAHRSQQWSFPWAGTQEFHQQGPTKGPRDPGFTPSPVPDGWRRRSGRRLRCRPMRSRDRVGACAHWVAVVPPRGEAKLPAR